jgi:hypothetical protein
MFPNVDRPSFPGSRRSSISTARVARRILLAGIAFSFLSNPMVHAASIPCADNPDALCYGDFMGDTVMYVNVREEATTTGDEEPLFGEPTIAGDSLDFDPVGFDASATGAGGNDITDSNLSFKVMAKPLHVIKNLTMSEAGDTTLLGLGTITTSTSVAASIFVDVEQVDGVGVGGISGIFSMTFTPSDGDYDIVNDGLGANRYHTNWQGSVFIDIMGMLDDAVANNIIPGYVNGATKISINMDNTLTALSEAGTFTVIAKKDAGGVSITVNIPEPSSILLASASLLAVGLVRRRGR